MNNTVQAPEITRLQWFMSAKKAAVADATGPKSVSFWGTVVGVLSGLTGLIFSLVASSDPVLVRSVVGAVGLAVVTVTTAIKIIHDKGVSLATIEALVKLLETNVPVLEADVVQYLPQIIAFLENVWPNALSELNKLESQVASLASSQKPPTVS